MNWLLICVSIIIGIGAIAGFAKGAVRIAVSLLATILTLVIVFFATPYVSKAIMSFTPLDDMIEEQCLKTIAGAVGGGVSSGTGLTEEQVRAFLEGAGVAEEQLAAAGITVEDIVNGKVSGADLEQYGISSHILEGKGHVDEEVKQSILDAEVPRQLQISAIEGADIPDVFKDLLLSNNNSEVYSSLGVTTFAEYLSKYLAKLIIGILAFLGTFLIVTIVVRAVVFALDIVSELPMLGILNRLAGVGVGVVISLIVVSFIFIIITLLYTTSVGKMLMGMINDNEFLSFLYNHNYVLKIATIFR